MANAYADMGLIDGKDLEEAKSTMRASVAVTGGDGGGVDLAAYVIWEDWFAMAMTGGMGLRRWRPVAIVYLFFFLPSIYSVGECRHVHMRASAPTTRQPMSRKTSDERSNLSPGACHSLLFFFFFFCNPILVLSHSPWQPCAAQSAGHATTSPLPFSLSLASLLWW